MLFLLIITFILVYITFLWIKKTSRINKLTAGMAHPRRLPILGSSLEFGTKSDEILKNVSRIVSECGPEAVAVWQGPELFVILSSPEDIEVVLASNKLINKSFVYDFLHPWLGVSLLTGTGEKWRKSRKMITPAFHFKILEQFTDVFNSSNTVLIKKLTNELGKPGFDIVNYINLCTLDIISESSMGIEVNAQSDDKSPFVQAIHQLSFAILYRSFKPWLYPEFCFRLSKTGQTFYKNLEIVHNFVQKVIKSKRQIRAQKEGSEEARKNEDFELIGTKKRAAFLDLLLDYSEAEGELTDDDIESEVNTFMFAGHDTTTSSISFTLYALMKNPDVQEKVVNELKEIFGDSDRLPDYNDLQSMKYLDKVIKESLRMYSPVPYVGRSASEDFTLKSGQIIPKGVSLIILIYQLHNDPKLYPDPEKFIPERYDSETMHNVQTKYPYAYCPFSAGPRNCIGQKFSVLEMKSIISTILRNFKLLPPIGLPDINLAAELILRSSTGINMRIVNR